MFKKVSLIFPNQLFENSPILNKDREVYLIEEPRYFTDFKFHKKKLVFHRASMKFYYDYLLKKGYKVKYFNFNKDWQESIINKEVYYIDVIDNKLARKIPKEAHKFINPGFLTISGEKKKHYHFTSFYSKQRKELNVLMENDKPIGGKLSFDKENRKKVPKDIKIPEIVKKNNHYIKEAKKYVDKNFKNNPGSLDDFIFPINFEDSKKWLNNFIEKKLFKFGDYEDAILQEEPYLFHSIISPLLNSGLLKPDYVLEKVLEKEAPINSKEGFIRQLIGWREFMMQIYKIEGENQRKSNFFRHKKKLSKSFYSAKTGLEPLDNVIKKVINNSYCHHIERLMILGNYMLLKETNPNQVYKWFMEMFIDAYDWVMVPNVYGMSQFADGGLITTKPYFSSSNYILKMSDFKKGEWCEVWNDLFWKFMKKNKKFLSKNPRFAMLIKRIPK